MTYAENLSLVELAEHYAKYHADECLEELAKRDKWSKMTHDERMGQRFEEPDNQQVFDFHKEVASAAKPTNNKSVNDPWNEGYETGHRIGFECGLKEGLPGTDSEEQTDENS